MKVTMPFIDGLMLSQTQITLPVNKTGGNAPGKHPKLPDLVNYATDEGTAGGYEGICALRNPFVHFLL